MWQMLPLAGPSIRCIVAVNSDSGWRRPVSFNHKSVLLPEASNDAI